jgi:hypothetical protein
MLIPLTPLSQEGNYKELQLKSPFEKGGFMNIHEESMHGKRYNPMHISYHVP